MTEASHTIASNPLPPGRTIEGTVVFATGTEIQVVDEQGTGLSADEVGHIIIRGPGLTAGYLENSAANADSFVDGWFKTGDLGALDDDGYLRLTGRAKELIIRGGESISPYEVEEALLSYAAVVDAVCFGIPDDKYGEEVGAAATVRAAATERELRAHCRATLAAFKVPKRVRILDEILRTATGKIQRRSMSSVVAGSNG
jgi:acyl-CoA synthetase (AMP-forming)/AMP-acid ligase II